MDDACLWPFKLFLKASKTKWANNKKAEIDILEEGRELGGKILFCCCSFCHSNPALSDDLNSTRWNKTPINVPRYRHQERRMYIVTSSNFVTLTDSLDETIFWHFECSNLFFTLKLAVKGSLGHIKSFVGRDHSAKCFGTISNNFIQFCVALSAS